ncbi:hypothetical protein [Streptomyces uncialis]|uniref:hypothetical protein n=1 Tax=Streptomyces uncialis TaxID=1048205 RepID=UPI0038640DE3|nr:hypothetical protein OG268_08290 [Streptomyces uncialis]
MTTTHRIRTAGPRARTLALGLALTTLTALTACGTTPTQPGTDRTESAGARPHGHVEGAEETGEAQSRLVLADGGSGAVHVLDLVTGEVTATGRAPGVRAMTGDGRYAYLSTPKGLTVVDSGGWTVDHGDHVHHYRATPRALDPVPVRPPHRIHTDAAVTAVTGADGTTRLLARPAPASDAPGRQRALRLGTAAPVVPYQGRLLVPGTGPGRDTVEVRDRTGKTVTVLDERCRAPRAATVTRRGAVLGCADGALIVSGEDGDLTAQRVPYGRPVAPGERATRFDHRPGATTLTARSGEDAVWVLDVTARRWTLIRTGPVAAVNTAGEGTPVLALGTDGVLRAYDPATGRRTASRALLKDPSGAGGTAVVAVDSDRAYVNDPGGDRVHEIDFGDGLRVARVLRLGFSPTHLVETGR